MKKKTLKKSTLASLTKHVETMEKRIETMEKLRAAYGAHTIELINQASQAANNIEAIAEILDGLVRREEQREAAIEIDLVEITEAEFSTVEGTPDPIAEKDRENFRAALFSPGPPADAELKRIEDKQRRYREWAQKHAVKP